MARAVSPRVTFRAQIAPADRSATTIHDLCKESDHAHSDPANSERQSSSVALTRPSRRPRSRAASDASVARSFEDVGVDDSTTTSGQVGGPYLFGLFVTAARTSAPSPERPWRRATIAGPRWSKSTLAWSTPKSFFAM